MPIPTLGVPSVKAYHLTVQGLSIDGLTTGVIRGARFYGAGLGVGGIRVVASKLVSEFKRLVLGQRKAQRDNLALLVATMLDVRSANLMALAAALPREAERADMRYQWVARVLGNGLIEPDVVMAPLAREVLAGAAAGRQLVVLILNQSKLSDRHQVLMLALKHGERALPLAWRVRANWLQGAKGTA